MSGFILYISVTLKTIFAHFLRNYASTVCPQGMHKRIKNETFNKHNNKIKKLIFMVKCV